MSNVKAVLAYLWPTERTDESNQSYGCKARSIVAERRPKRIISVCGSQTTGVKLSEIWCRTNIRLTGPQRVGGHTVTRDKESREISRRSFIQRTAIGGAGLLAAMDIVSPDLNADTPKNANSTMIGVPFEAREQVRLGIIGVGGRGTSLLQDLLAVEKVEVKAICDLVPEKVARAQKAVTEAGQPEPAGFSKGEWDFKNLTQLELDSSI